MSLVDYPSSDDDDVSEEEVRENKENEPQQQLPSDVPRPHTQLVVSSYQQPESSAPASAPSIQQLPDASMLLNSPVSSSNMLSSGNHSSRVAAAMSESSSRKRESAFASSVPRNKVPRGNLPHSKNVPDTVGGLLVPPQLRGRSNIVTEDVGKLFVKKQADPSPK